MASNHNNEVTIKEILQMLGEYLEELIKHWKLVCFMGLMFGAVFAVKASLTPTEFKEQLTFMMDDSGGESTVPGLEVLGDLFGSGGGSGENLDKILQLFESKKIIHNTLFDSVLIGERRDFLVNHFLEKYSLSYLVQEYRLLGFYYSPEWPKLVLGKDDFRFSHSEIERFTDEENLILRVVFERINGGSGIPRRLNSTLDQNSGIMTLSYSSEHQELTLGMLNNIYEQLSMFFIEKATEKQSKTFNIMKEKRDSVIYHLKTKEFQLANFKDSNRRLVTVKGYLEQLRLERDVSILNVMYAEVIKQLEATDFALKNKTPIVQIIDLPRTPIIPHVISWKINLIFGGVVGAVICSVFVLLRKLFRDIMA